MGNLLKYFVSGAAAVFVAEWVSNRPELATQSDTVKAIAKYGSGGAAIALAHKFLGPKLAVG